MSLIAWYLLNDPATLLEDNSGNGHTLTNENNVVTEVDSEHGTVAYFTNGPCSYLSLASAPVSTLGASPRTFSYWVKQIGTESYRIMFGQGTSPELRVQFSLNNFDINGGSGYNTSTPSASGVWLYITLTYDGTTERTYFNGVLNKTAVVTYNTGAGSFLIGAAPNFNTVHSINGYITDFRIYDDALSDSDISTLHSTGPTDELVLDPVGTFFGTPGSVYANLSWDASNTYYRIDITDPSLTTSTVTSGIEDLEFAVSNLLPETSYTVELYTSSDDVTYNLESSATFTTLENTAANFDSSEFFDGTEMLYDFESFDSGTLAIIGEIFDELFATGDTLRLKDSTDVTYNTSFVENGSTVTLSDNSSFYIPFESTGGTGQNVSLTLSDTTTVLVEYNQINGSITIDGTTTYSVGNSFILDGKTIFVSST